jgi:hypothetical protein
VVNEAWGVEKKDEGDVGRCGAADDTGPGGVPNRPRGGGVGDCLKPVEASEPGTGPVDNLNLEGDRESDLRNDRTAEPTST